MLSSLIMTVFGPPTCPAVVIVDHCRPSGRRCHHVTVRLPCLCRIVEHRRPTVHLRLTKWPAGPHAVYGLCVSVCVTIGTDVERFA